MQENLGRDPRIAFLSFTGSRSVGWHLRTIAGRKKVGLELGGNAAVIVHEDANLDFAADRIATGGFINAVRSAYLSSGCWCTALSTIAPLKKFSQQ